MLYFLSPPSKKSAYRIAGYVSNNQNKRKDLIQEMSKIQRHE